MSKQRAKGWSMIGFLTLALAACAPAGETGVSVLGTAPEGQAIVFELQRDGAWETLATHEGAFDSRAYDYRLAVGEPVVVRAWAKGSGHGGTAVSVDLALTPEDDVAYAMMAAVAVEDPTALCMGCGEPVSVPIDPAAPNGERLWLYQTYNGISAPIMF